MNNDKYTEIVQEIKGAELYRIIERYLPLKKSGSVWVGCSPFTSDKTPSFVVYPHHWIDFAGGGGKENRGDAIDFVSRIENCTFLEAIETLCTLLSIPLPPRKKDALDPFPVLSSAAQYYKTQLDENPAVQKLILDKWGVSVKTQQRAGLGFASGKGLLSFLSKLYSKEEIESTGLIRKNKEYFFNRIMFPHLDGGRVVWFSGRDIDGTQAAKYLRLATHSDSNPTISKLIKHPGLYLRWLLPKEPQRVVVCEGLFDALAGLDCGFPSVSLYSTSPPQKALSELSLLGRTHPLSFCLDPDTAGTKAALSIGSRLHREGARVGVVSLPSLEERKNDLAEFLKAGGNLRTLLDAAPSIPEIKVSLLEPLQGTELEASILEMGPDLEVLPPTARNELLGVITKSKGLNSQQLNEMLSRGENGGDKIELPITLDSESLVQKLEPLLSLLSPQVFQWGGRLVSIATNPDPTRKGDTPTPRELTKARLQTLLEGYISFFRKPKGKQKTYCSLPDKIVSSLLDLGVWPSVPALSGVTSAPYLSPSGLVQGAPGYHEETGVYLSQSFDMPPVYPDQEEKALLSILGVVVDFPFETPSSRAVWLAYVLTLLSRPAIEGNVPGFLFNANTRGTGKTILAEGGFIVGTQTLSPYKCSFPKGDEREQEKLFLSIARGARPCVIFDEVKSVGSDPLNNVLTSTTYAGRELNFTNDLLLPWKTTLCFTGNNVTVRGDCDRRFLECRLSSLEENPENRNDFEIKDLLSYIKKNKEPLARAALILLRSAAQKGRPSVTPWGSFSEWSTVVRGTIATLIPLSKELGPQYELDDPIKARPAPELSPEKTYTQSFIDSLFADAFEGTAGDCLDQYWGGSGFLGSKVATHRKEIQEAVSYLLRLPPGKSPSVRALGELLSRLKDRVLGGLFLTVAGRKSSGMIWQVQKKGLVH